MNSKQDLIKDLIKYLTNVYNGEKIEGLSQSFFISNKELDKILSEYFIFFKNENELLSDVKYNYNLIKDISFPNVEVDFIYVKDLSIENTISYSKTQHHSYSHRIHSHLIRVFEEKLNNESDFSVNENPYPLLFISGDIYTKIIEYTFNNIIDYYLDYSYLKKRLEHDKLIHRVKDNEFMLFAYEDKKIKLSQSQYEDYREKGKLTSLNKSSTANRENNFNNIFSR